MINAYKNYWKGYLDFKGRTDLPGYWLAVLAGFIVCILVNILSQIIASSRGSSGSSSLLLVYFLITLLPSLSITVRRLRDGGKSWANLFWLFLPLAGPIVLIVKLCASSQTLNAFSSGPAPVSREAPLYRSYQPQAGTAASVSPAAPAAEEQKKAGEGRKQDKDMFYVFAAKGAAFGNPGGDIKAIIREKAEKLRDGYEPAKNMELSVIYPEAWGGTIAVSSQNGIITSSVSFADHKQAIRNYLKKAGADSRLIEAGIAESEKESLMLSNPFSGITVIGIPVAAEKPAVPADAGKPRNNFCMNCGAKLSENAEVCSQCGSKVPDSW